MRLPHVRRAPVWLWGSLTPPRIVSLLAALTYAVLTSCGIAVLVAQDPIARDVTAGAVALIMGAVLAAPAAWRGWWGVEAPAAALALLGLATITVVDLLRSLTTDLWPGWPGWLSLALCLMLTQRVLRIWGVRWQPGMEPDTALRRQERHTQVVRALSTGVVEGRGEWDGGAS